MNSCGNFNFDVGIKNPRRGTAQRRICMRVVDEVDTQCDEQATVKGEDISDVTTCRGEKKRKNILNCEFGIKLKTSNRDARHSILIVIICC